MISQRGYRWKMKMQGPYFREILGGIARITAKRMQKFVCVMNVIG